MGSQLRTAAFLGQDDEVTRLHGEGASVNTAGPDMRTALHLSALTGHVESVKTLVGFRANSRIEARLAVIVRVDGCSDDGALA